MGYSFRFLKPHHPYLAVWTEYHRRRQRCLEWLVAYLAAFGLGSASIGVIVASRGSQPLSWWMAIPVLVAWIVAPLSVLGGFAIFWLLLFSYFHMLCAPCPRCGRAFAWTWYWSGFVTRCLHCGLEEYAPCDPAEQQWEFESQMPK